MTTFNAGEFLEVAVRSIEDQDYQDWELVLVNNSSTDGSVESLVTVDRRIHIINLQYNQGRTKALQIAFHEARGKYIAILDADDVAYRQRLRLQKEFLQDNPEIVLVGSRVEYISASGHAQGVPPQLCGYISEDEIAERNHFYNSSLMFKKSIAKLVGGYDQSFQYAQDFHLSLKLASKGKVFVMDEILCQIRKHEMSLTKSSMSRLNRVRDECRLFEFASANLHLTPTGRRLNRRRLAICNLELSLVEFKQGNWGFGSRALLRALRHDPLLTWIPYVLSGRRQPSFRSR